MQPADSSKAEFDAYSAKYDDHVNRALAFAGVKVDFFNRMKTEHLLAFMASHASALSQVALLDVGCGNGNCHPLLVRRVARLCGIDVSVASIDAARERNPGAQYAHYDGVNIPHDDAAFDFAFAACVFHHVPLNLRGQLVADIRRVLKPGGFFIIFEHNPWNPLTMRVVNRCEFDRDAVLLTSRTCEDLIREGGFARVETRFILNVPALNAPLRLLDRWLSRLPLGAQYCSVGQK